MIKSGLSLTELLISVFALAIITLGVANFSENIFQVTFEHSKLVEEVDESRFSLERIVYEVNRADYILPSGKTIALSGSGFSASINTNEAIVMLILNNDDDPDSPKYNLTAFYFALASNGRYELRQFFDSSTYTWQENTIPSIPSALTGTSTVIATDIDKAKSELTYYLNQENGIFDTLLRGEVAGITPDSSDALIKGIEWKLVCHKNTEKSTIIKGLSNNVPRFIN